MTGLGTYLAPFEVDGGYGRIAVVHPDVADQWVPGAGSRSPATSTTPLRRPHFDELPHDHRSRILECADSAHEVVAACRSRFVVTDIEVVDGP